MRVLLADANPDVRAALRLVIEQHAGIQITGEAQDVTSLFKQAAACCPDVILVDANLPGLRLPSPADPSSLAELVAGLRRVCPPARLIAMSSWPTAEKACRLARVDAFICKSDPPDSLLELLEHLPRPAG